MTIEHPVDITAIESTDETSGGATHSVHVLGFSYHNNTVGMTFNVNGYKLIEATFTVSDFSITDGQDPNHVNKVGQAHNYGGSYGEIGFTVGRKGSSQVASWWSARIAPYQNTFNHNPDDLNFAFIGRLELVLTGGTLGGGQERFTLDDIGIAQGHTNVSNNWWFGGKNCMNRDDNTVRASGHSPNKGIWHFDFRRGGLPQSTSLIELNSLTTS